MRTTAIMNLKGGTGKTVSTLNTAAILAEIHGFRVLTVDADSQANLTESLSRSPMDAIRVGGLSDLLRGLPGFTYPTKIQNVDILPGDETLMALDITSAGNGSADTMALADFLESRTDKWDRVLIDCPPAFSAGAMAALIAADEVVIPLKLDAFGIRGLANLMEQVRNMRRINPDLTIAGVLPTMCYPDQMQRDAEEKLRHSLAGAGVRTFPHIRRSTKVDGSTFEQQSMLRFSPKSKTTTDYKRFVAALLKGGEDDEL